jgi:hypothetical protein
MAVEPTNSRHEGQRHSVRTARGRNGNAPNINRPQGPKGEMKMSKMNVANAHNINQEEIKMSEMNVVEPFDKTHTDAGLGNDQKESVTEQALATALSFPSLHLRPRKDIEMETCARVADQLRRLAAALNDGLELPSACEDPQRHYSSDALAWAISDVAETLTRLAEVFDETPRYLTLGASARKAARAVEELEEHWTKRVIGNV